jgi:C2HC-type zinc finger protein
VKGTQKKLTCPKCGKTFTAWRPDDLPGAPVKCYFCGNQFADEAAQRKPAAPPAPAPPAPAAETPIAPAAAAAGEPEAN